MKRSKRRERMKGKTRDEEIGERKMKKKREENRKNKALKVNETVKRFEERNQSSQ